jgi:hypothetical protein
MAYSYLRGNPISNPNPKVQKTGIFCPKRGMKIGSFDSF